MDTLKIEIKGLGGTISDEVYYIANILKENVYDVTIYDNHPPKESDEQIRKNKLKSLDDDYKKEYKIEGKGRKVELTANHKPWPG